MVDWVRKPGDDIWRIVNDKELEAFASFEEAMERMASLYFDGSSDAVIFFDRKPIGVMTCGGGRFPSGPPHPIWISGEWQSHAPKDFGAVVAGIIELAAEKHYRDVR